MTIRSFMMGSLAALAIGISPAMAADDLRVWGGGNPDVSVYSKDYVPRVIEVLAANTLNGYTWAGVSAGTVQNAQEVTLHPTNLAVGQLDLLKDLQGQPIPGTDKTYSFTILNENIGPECLYMVTAQQGYTNFGEVLANAWQMNVATGGEKSGSYATLKRIQGIYPELVDLQILPQDSTDKILEAVAKGEATHGFFIMRPDPKSKVFESIAKAKLNLVPMVDILLDDDYDFLELKVAYGGLFSGDKFHQTACTSVALITGAPQAVDPTDTRAQKRLAATINKIKSIPAEQLRPNLSNWRDMFDSIKAIANDKLTAAFAASAQAAGRVIQDVNSAIGNN